MRVLRPLGTGGCVALVQRLRLYELVSVVGCLLNPPVSRRRPRVEEPPELLVESR